jgi:hypothetical protein
MGHEEANWIYLAQNRDECQAVLKMAMERSDSIKGEQS